MTFNKRKFSKETQPRIKIKSILETCKVPRSYFACDGDQVTPCELVSKTDVEQLLLAQ